MAIGRRILIVDDNPDMANTFALLLTYCGYEAEGLSHPERALERVAAFSPDAVFLDIGMPGLDGFQLARLLRQRYGNQIKLVAVTGYGESAFRQESLKAGFDVHLIKPVESRTVERVLELLFDPQSFLSTAGTGRCVSRWRGKPAHC